MPIIYPHYLFTTLWARFDLEYGKFVPKNRQWSPCEPCNDPQHWREPFSNVTNARKHLTKLEVWMITSSPILERSHTNVHNAAKQLFLPVNLELTWSFTLEKNCTPVHNAVNHSIMLEIWKGSCSLILLISSTIVNNAFGVVENLKTHLFTHSGEKPHKCVQCNYSSTHASALKRHIMKHTGVKPHQCGHCEYSSTTLAHMRRHEMTHSGEKPHKCSQCDFSQLAIWQYTREPL